MAEGAKAALLRAGGALGLFALAGRVTRGDLRILAYHGLWTTPGHQFGNRLFMSPEQGRGREEVTGPIRRPGGGRLGSRGGVVLARLAVLLDGFKP